MKENDRLFRLCLVFGRAWNEYGAQPRDLHEMKLTREIASENLALETLKLIVSRWNPPLGV